MAWHGSHQRSEVIFYYKIFSNASIMLSLPSVIDGYMTFVTSEDFPKPRIWHRKTANEVSCSRSQECLAGVGSTADEPPTADGGVEIEWTGRVEVDSVFLSIYLNWRCRCLKIFGPFTYLLKKGKEIQICAILRG